jgi:hypothetical protein
MKCKNCDSALIKDNQFCTQCGFCIREKEKRILVKEVVNHSIKFDYVTVKFLRQNWFKIFLLILIAGAITFWTIYLQKNIAEKIVYEGQNDCRELVSSLKRELEHEIESDKERGVHSFLSYWEYRYNKNTKRCILVYKIDNGFLPLFELDTGSDYVIKDVFTNESLFEKREVERGPDSINAHNQLLEKRDYYFDEK